MTDLADEELDSILKAKFGWLLDWSAPQIEPTIGPYNPEVFQQIEVEKQELLTRCVEALRSYPRGGVDLILEHPRDDPGGLLKEWHEFLTLEIRWLKKKIPPWYAAGFGHPAYVADFDYWSKMPTFAVEEALCLSIGIEPRTFTKKTIQELQRDNYEKLWPSLQFLLRRHELMRRKFDSQGFNWRVKPRDFLRWSRQVEFDAHPEFLRLLENHHASDTVPDSSSEAAKRTDPREIDSMSQLFTAIAICAYGYDPEQKRSPIPKEIAELAASLGLNISDETVRKYLKRGAKLLPPDWKPNEF